MIHAQAIGSLLEAAIDTEELVRTAAISSLRKLASSEDKATSTLRAAIAFLQANVATGNAKTKTIVLRKRVHILRAIATIGEVGSSFISPDLAQEVATLAVEELLHSNEKIAGWELSSTHVLVSLCPTHMNLVLTELVNRMKPGNPPNMSILYALECVASRSSEAFVGGMARVTSRIVPMLGSIANWKLQVQVAASFSAFCDAVNTTSKRPNDVPSDIAAAVNSVCDIFLTTWLGSGRSQVRGATGRALGAMINILGTWRVVLAVFLVGAGWCWLVLVGAGWCWLVLVGAGWCWLVLVGAGSCWFVLVRAGSCWLLLVRAGCCWLLLVAAGCCWLLLPLDPGWWCISNVFFLSGILCSFTFFTAFLTQTKKEG
jgi:hypothetical protein